MKLTISPMVSNSIKFKSKKSINTRIARGKRRPKLMTMMKRMKGKYESMVKQKM
jgi:hypothetical protein